MTARLTRKNSGRKHFLVDQLERRVLLSGELDPNFGIGGFTQGPSSSTNSPTYTYQITAIQSDGKLLGLGNSDKTGGTFAFRFLPNGTLDPSFGNGGIALVGNKGVGVFILQSASGNYFVDVNGIQTQVSSSTFSSDCLFELSSSGAVNEAFGVDGHIDFGGNNAVKYGAVQGDSIVVGVSEGQGLEGFGLGKIFKYGPDGVLESSFGNQGSVELSSDINGMVSNAAGQIVIFGTANNANTVGLYVLNSDGSINSALGSTEETTVNGLISLAPQADSSGRFYYATTASSTAIALHRLNADGSMDSTFNPVTLTASGGFVVETDGSFLSAEGSNVTPAVISHYSPTGTLESSSAASEEDFGPVLPLADGSYIVAGSTYTLKYEADGVLDASFGTDGTLTALDVSHPPATYSSIATQSNGKIVAAGVAATSNGDDFYVTRFNTNGSIDDSFGNSGVAQVAFGALQVKSVSVLTEPDDSIIVAGNYSNPALAAASASGIIVAKLTATGSFVSSFGTSGSITLPGETDPSLGWQDQKLLIASKTTLRRYNSDGTVDSSFATGLPGGTISAIQPDGKILFHATDNLSFPNFYDVGLYRFNADGTPDSNFVRFGFYGLSSYQDSLDSAVVESSGRIVMLGLVYGGPQIPLTLTAINPDGSADTTFGSSGSTVINQSADVVNPTSLLLQPNGELLVVIPQPLGIYTSGSSVLVERFSAAGQLDTGFGVDGSVQIGASSTPSPAITTVPVNAGGTTILDSSGRLLIAGAAGTVGPDLFAMSTTGSEVPGPAVKMVFISQPTDQFTGSAAYFAVAMEDANGAVATGDTSPITYSQSNDPGYTDGINVLGGFAVPGPVGIYNQTPSTNDTITVTDPEAPSITTSAFSVATPAQFVSQPTGNVATGDLAPIVVDLLKMDGTIDTTNDSYVTLTGADFTGTTIVAAVTGVATFDNLTIQYPSQKNSLAVTVGYGSAGTSETFNTVLVPQLVFVEYPTGSKAPGPLGPVSVNLLDANGNLLSSSDISVTVGIHSSSGLRLGGTLTVAAVNGVATFNDLSIATAASSVSLFASTDAGDFVSGADFNVGSVAVTPPVTTPPVTTPPVVTPSTLVPTLKTVRLPTQNVAGAKLNALIPVVIINSGAAVKGVAITVYADQSSTLDGNQVLVASFQENVAFKFGQQRKFNLNVKALPASLAAGKYYLLVELTDPSRDTNVIATPQTVMVAVPAIQLIAGMSTLASKPINSRQTVSFLVTFANEGNIAGQLLEMTLTVSTVGVTPEQGATQVALKRAGTFKPVGSRSFKISMKADALPAGVYYPTVSVSLDGNIATADGSPFTVD